MAASTPHATPAGSILDTTNYYTRRIVHGGKWQNYAAGIALGAAYSCLYGVHWHPHGLTIFEMVLFLLNCFIFLVNTILLIVSGFIKRQKFLETIQNPTTTLLVPLIAIDFVTICLGILFYADEFGSFSSVFPLSYIAVFWTYFAVSIACCVPLIVLWFGSVGKAHELSSFSLTGCFLVFPMMLIGTLAFNTLARIDPNHPHTLPILILGYTFQGLGFSVAMCFIVVSQYRSIRYGFHRGASAASAFIAAGPPGYTALTVLRLGQYGRKVLPRHTILPQEAADAIYWCSIPFALFLIGLALYFWFFALIPWLTSAKAHVYLNPAGSWPMTFPSSGIPLTFAALGDALGVKGFYILQLIWASIIVFEVCVLFFAWLYRLIRPADPAQREARSKAWNQEQLSFWGSYREAEIAERKYLRAKKANGGATPPSWV